MTILYGISTCDTVRKARKWLQGQDIDYTYHDLRKDGVSARQLADWLGKLGWETLVNRRSTTWRALPEADRDRLDSRRAAALLETHPTLIKRPVLESGGALMVGFSPDRYQDFFG